MGTLSKKPLNGSSITCHILLLPPIPFKYWIAQRRPIQIPVHPGNLPDDLQLISVSVHQCQLDQRETDSREIVIALLFAMFLQPGGGKSC